MSFLTVGHLFAGTWRSTANFEDPKGFMEQRENQWERKPLVSFLCYNVFCRGSLWDLSFKSDAEKKDILDGPTTDYENISWVVILNHHTLSARSFRKSSSVEKIPNRTLCLKIKSLSTFLRGFSWKLLRFEMADPSGMTMNYITVSELTEPEAHESLFFFLKLWECWNMARRALLCSR